MRLITLNGVKLFVYLNGNILRYSDVAKGRLKKGWSEVKGYINNKGYLIIRLNGKNYKIHRIVGYAFLGLDIDNPKQIIDHIDRNKQNNNMNNLRIVSHQEIYLIETQKDIISTVKIFKHILVLTIKKYILDYLTMKKKHIKHI